MATKRTLELTINKQWFDLIASGEKKEEYRELKDFWKNRLMDKEGEFLYFKHFDQVRFRNGYSPTSPVIVLECKGVSIDYGKQKWGAEKGAKYFVVKLGKILKRPQKH
jgi:hypothetical protein